MKLLHELYRRTSVTRRHSVILEASSGDVQSRQSYYAAALSADDKGPTTSTRMASYAQHASQLALSASTKAIAGARIDPAAIENLVTVSCSGFSAPGFDLALIDLLGLDRSVSRTHVGFMGCHGALNGLRVATAFARSNPTSASLVCASELCSLHQQYGWDAEQIVANALFADGAAAMVVVGDRCASPVPRRIELVANTSYVIPESANMMTWQIGDHGFAMTLSPKLPELIHSHLREWITGWLASDELAIDGVSHWAVHPGGPRVVSATGEALGLSPDQLQPSRSVLADFGNMSSPTTMFIVQRIVEAGATGYCVALGYGPGITIEAALLKLV